MERTKQTLSQVWHNLRKLWYNNCTSSVVANSNKGNTMAINVLNSQGTKIYVDESTTPLADCSAAVAALGTAKLVGCPQSIGDISETRTVTEYKCLSSNESAKALGAISRGSLEIGLLLDPNDTAGQKALKDAFKSNTLVNIIIELPDSQGTNGTLYYFQAGVSGVSTGITQDEAITYTVTLEISSDISECPAA